MLGISEIQLNIIGIAAIIAINIAPMNVILDNTFDTYFVFSVPGLIPGMYPFCLFRFFDISSGFTAATKV